ncbi:SRPBCC family protein [Azospirillum halopraeferens]|uniref:SRPBCC family protein n=1 Tax=Azospirillum halopraeferens TaxID=34010 RepID=UPI0003F76650|nr:SRPBCC family protein [Azospirillum halopraeferens]
MPRITQSFTVAFPRDRVWPLLADAGQVVDCMPGAALDGPVQDGRIAGRMRVKLGPIAADFAGEGELALDPATHSGTISGQGTDARNNSRARGAVTFTVAEDAGGAETRVDLSVDFTLTGTLAQFGRAGIVNEIARRLAGEFARNLEARLAAEAPLAPPAPPAARELNAAALLLAIIRDWIKGLPSGLRRRSQ